MGDSFVGLQARLMSQALRKLTGLVAKTNTCLIFINQIREKIGVMFGSPETTTGGRALKFYSSVRIDIRRIGTIKDGETVKPVGGAHEGRRWSRTRWRHRSGRSSSTSSSTRASTSNSARLLDMGVENGVAQAQRHVVELRRPASRAGPRTGARVPDGEPRAPGRSATRSSESSRRTRSAGGSGPAAADGVEDSVAPRGGSGAGRQPARTGVWRRHRRHAKAEERCPQEPHAAPRRTASQSRSEPAFAVEPQRSLGARRSRAAPRQADPQDPEQSADPEVAYASRPRPAPER